MSGMMEKVKAKVDQVMHKDKTHDDPTGPHSSHTANTVDPTVHNTSSATTGTGGFSGTHQGSGVSTGLGTSGTHGSTGLGSSTTHGSTGLGSSTTHGTSSHNDPTGPHSSHMMNKADPRVDSDRLGNAGNTAGAGGYGAGQYTESHGTHGSTGLGSSTTHGSTGLGSSTTHGSTGLGSSTTHGTSSHNDPTGPHSSHLLNKADPRVDSDRLGNAGNTAGAGGHGAGQYTESHGTHGTGSGLTGHSSTGTGLGSSTTGAYGSGHSSGLTGGHGTSDYNDPSGPHSSRIANQADPRVGGGIGSTGAGAYNTTGSGVTGHSTTGGLGHSHNDPTGPHSSHLANQADPRVGGVGSTGTGAYGSNTSGIGQGDYTTGEHVKTFPGEVGGTGRDNQSQLYNESGDLPKALTEPVSHAEPHSSLQHDQHISGHGTHGTHGTSDVHGKPSMMDKLNPKKDADHDGKAGFMD